MKFLSQMIMKIDFCYNFFTSYKQCQYLLTELNIMKQIL
jgi:hypothetical protein